MSELITLMKKVAIFILILGTLLFNLSKPGIAAVDLLCFIAEPRATSIMLYWEAAMKIAGAGFRIHQEMNALGPFYPISPLIPSIPDPFLSHFFRYEDLSVVLGSQHCYVLKILNADGSSEYSLPVGAINISSSSTLGLTSTSTNLAANTPTFTLLATRTPNLQLPTSTLTITTIPTATRTHTVTPTLVISAPETIIFPALSPVENEIPLTSDNTVSATPTYTSMDNPLQTDNPSSNILFLAILLWVALAIFLLLFIRRISRHENNKP